MKTTSFFLPAFLLAGLLSPAARAQTVTYLSNLGSQQGGAFEVATNMWTGQSFKTGVAPAGYALDSIKVSTDVYQTGDGTTPYLVWIYSDNAGKPGGRIALLNGPIPTGPAYPNYATNTYTPSGTVVLPPATTYWVVSTSPGNIFYQWSFGPDQNYSASDGWTINTQPAQSTDGGTWSLATDSFVHPMQMSVQAHPLGMYFQDFSAFAVGATNFNDGSTLSSTSPSTVSGVVDGTYKELRLTADGTPNTRTGFLLPDLSPGIPVYAFSAKWNSVVFADFQNSAGLGFSFNLGPLAGLDLTSAIYNQQTGYDLGLSVDVVNQLGGAAFYVRVNGGLAATAPYTPLTQWGQFNDTRHFFEVDWHEINGLTLRVDGQTIFSNVNTYGFVSEPGDRFAWGAQAGNPGEDVRLDNIVVVTGGNLASVPVTTPFYKDPNSDTLGASPAYAFDGDNSTFWTTYASSGFVGGTLSPAANIRAYALTSGSADRSSDPLNWSLEGSANAGANWSACGTGTGKFVHQSETHAWLATNANSYGAYRLNISQNNGNSGSTRLAELRAYQNTNDFIPPAWTRTADPGLPWSDVVCSADGSKLAGAPFPGNIYYSVNSGSSWTAHGDNDYWASLAASADASTLVAAKNQTGIYYSTDSGVSWFLANVGFGLAWDAVGCSTNGHIMYAAASGNSIYFSTNSGANWAQTGAGVQSWSSLAVSADGTRVAAVIAGGGIWISTNSGASFNLTSAVSDGWFGIACSANFSKLVACVHYNTGVYVSTDSGLNWVKTGLPSANAWNGVAASADGHVMLAASDRGVYLSTDYGAHWGLSTAPAVAWNAVACSADGARLVAAGNSGIWTGSIIPSPPQVTTQSATLVNASNATLNAAVKAYGLPTTVLFAWGTTTSYGNTNSVSAGNSSDVVNSVNLSSLVNLSPATTYHFQAFATNAASRSLSGGGDLSFTTLGAPATVTTAAADQITATSARLNGTVTPNYLNTSIAFQYGLTLGYGSSVSLPATNGANSPLPISGVAHGLLPGTTYHFGAVAQNSLNAPSSAFGADMVFTTLATNANFGITSPADPITGSSGNSYPGQFPPQAIDDSASTKYLNFDKFNTGFTVQPAVTNRPVQALGLISADDLPERDPASFVLKGSMDGTSFTTIVSNGVPLFPERGSIQSFTFANTNTWLFYQIIFPTVSDPAQADSMQIGEVEFLPYGEITSTNDALALTLPSGASLNGIAGPAALLDRKLSQPADKFVALNVTSNVVAVITPAAGSSILKGFELIGGYDDTVYPGRGPSTFTLEGSNDGTNYFALASVNPKAPASNLQLQDFATYGNSNAYTHYRATFGLPQSGSTLQIGELRLFGVTSPALAATPFGGNLLLSWPASGFVLQQETNLNGSNWIPGTNSITVTNGRSQATVPRSTNPNFYRLKSQ